MGVAGAFRGTLQPARLARGERAKGAILLASRQLFGWVARYGLDCEFAETGTDYVFRDTAGLESLVRELELMAEHGIASECIDGGDYLRQEPALRDGVVGVVRFPGDASLRPDRYVAGLARALRAAGGEIVEQCDVHAVAVDGNGVRVSGSSGDYRGSDVVLAAGAWSPRLARTLAIAIRCAQGHATWQGLLDHLRSSGAGAASPVGAAWAQRLCHGLGSGFRLGSTMGFPATTMRSTGGGWMHWNAAHANTARGGRPVKREEWFGWRP